MSDELVKACRENNYDLVERLIASGANIDHIGIYKCSALMFSARAGYTEIVDLIIKKGAKIDLEDESGRTALYYAGDVWGRSDKLDILELLVNAGADIDHLDKANNTPLMHAIRHSGKVAVNFHIKNNAKLNVQNFEGNTTLMLAVSNILIDLSVVKLMIDRGANLNTQNNEGNTALIMLIIINISNKSINKANALRSKLDARFVNEYTEEFIDLCEFSITHGADITLKNKQGETAFSLSKKLGNERLIAIFEKTILDKQIADNEEVEVMGL